jgi:hypothetical protein
MRIFSTSILTAAILAMTACDGWCASMKTPAGGTGSSAAASNRLGEAASDGGSTKQQRGDRPRSVYSVYRQDKQDQSSKGLAVATGQASAQSRGNAAMDRLQGIQGGM